MPMDMLCIFLLPWCIQPLMPTEEIGKCIEVNSAEQPFSIERGRFSTFCIVQIG